MTTTLHLAISADGFIARSNGDSDWVSATDELLFKNRAREIGCIVVGKRTFEQYQEIIYPIKGTINIVLSTHPDLKIDGVFLANSPEVAVELACKQGCTNILIAGGAHTSASFLKAGLIDEVFFSVHPLVLGGGMKPFEGEILEKKLKLIASRRLDDEVVELHYKVLR